MCVYFDRLSSPIGQFGTVALVLVLVLRARLDDADEIDEENEPTDRSSNAVCGLTTSCEDDGDEAAAARARASDKEEGLAPLYQPPMSSVPPPPPPSPPPPPPPTTTRFLPGSIITGMGLVWWGRADPDRAGGRLSPKVGRDLLGETLRPPIRNISSVGGTAPSRGRNGDVFDGIM